MTIARRGLKVRVKVEAMAQANVVGPTSIEGSYSNNFVVLPIL